MQAAPGALTGINTKNKPNMKALKLCQVLEHHLPLNQLPVLPLPFEQTSTATRSQNFNFLFSDTQRQLTPKGYLPQAVQKKPVILHDSSIYFFFFKATTHEL